MNTNELYAHFSLSWRTMLIVTFKTRRTIAAHLVEPLVNVDPRYAAVKAAPF